MGSISGVISSLSSLAAKLLPGSGRKSSSSDSDECQIIERELKKLTRTLERIKATLYDALEREVRDRSVKLWLKELKEVAYSMEDLLDGYRYEILRVEVEERNDSAENALKRKKLELPDGMVDRIKETMSRLDEIANHRVALQLRELDVPRRCNDEMLTTPTSCLVVESNIFGREKEKEDLIDLLRLDNTGDIVSVLTVVGMGGLGKTTLAQLVYNDPRIRQEFDLFGWVCVSDDFSIERLTKEVVESVTRCGCDVKNLSVLQEKLREEIEGKSFFLVLDDVWNEKRSVWELFRTPLLCAKSAKILVTTRNEPVARIMQTIPSFKLQDLSQEQCWQLFEQYAFGGANCNEAWKLEIGEQIMGKCGRLPLAVKTIASLLRHEESEESWIEILESELWELEATKEIFPPLQISYSRLPTYLKPCFLYCSMFPKDYQYQAKVLAPLWYAHGYIDWKGRKTIKEIGEDHATQLIERSFFEGDCKSFKLHDLIHDLAKSNSNNECYSLEYGKSLIPVEQIRHLYVKDHDELNDLVSSSSFTPLRTLIMATIDENVTNAFDILNAHTLRAIVFESPCYEFGFLNSIGNFKHLRCMLLKGYTYKKLPESVCSLYNLQILSLDICPGLTELPNSIGSLMSLQFLSLFYCSVIRFPESICRLRNLKVLYVNDSKLIELPEHIGNLVSLEELVLHQCCITLLPVSLCELRSLKILKVTSRKNLKELPREIEHLINLQILSIDEVFSPPPRLNKLTRLQYLDLDFNITMSNNQDEFGYLSNIINLKGTLVITGLQNVTNNLVDSKQLNLMNMKKLEGLILSWSTESYVCYRPVETSQIKLKIQYSGHDGSHSDEMDLILLERLRPHANLKGLGIICYPGIAFSEWIGDPFACISLEHVYLYRCENLVLLPFSNLQTLKHLEIYKCSSLQIIQDEFVPSQLQKLVIRCCMGLIAIPGIQRLKSLVELKISQCLNLKSLLREPEPSLELIRHTDDSFYHLLFVGLTDLVSLRTLQIVRCPKLRVVTDELCPVESCIVRVRDCPNLREWCLGHNFDYTEFEGTKEEEEEEEE